MIVETCELKLFVSYMGRTFWMTQGPVVAPTDVSSVIKDYEGLGFKILRVEYSYTEAL